MAAKASEVISKTTPKPPEFTDGTLITAMVNAHRFESNPELKKRLKEGDGIGTEATRAATIQKLLRSKMLERKGKDRLTSTEFGRSIIDMLPEDLRSLGMTALWEGLLSQVEKGAVEPEAFLERHARAIADRIEKSKGSKITVRGVTGGTRPIKGHGDTCPRCGSGTLITREVFTGENKGRKYLKCSNQPDCQFSCSELSVVLPGHGKECTTCHRGKMWSREITSKKDGKKYALLSCTNYPDCRAEEWPERPAVPPIVGDGKTCPKCGVGIMKTKQIKSKSGETYIVLSCNAYPNCQNTEWPERKVSKVLPGDGKTCALCNVGIMRTREYKDKKDGSTKQFLSCSNNPACKGVIWPERQPATDKTAPLRAARK